MSKMQFTCDCGQMLLLTEKHDGRLSRCPKCKREYRISLPKRANMVIDSPQPFRRPTGNGQLMPVPSPPAYVPPVYYPTQPARPRAIINEIHLDSQRGLYVGSQQKVLVEATSKPIKAWILLSLFVVIIGFMLGFLSPMAGRNWQAVAMISFVTWGLGSVSFIAACLYRFWQHG